MPDLVFVTSIALPVLGALSLLLLDVTTESDRRWESLPTLLVLTTFVAVLSLPGNPLSWTKAARWIPLGPGSSPTLVVDEFARPFVWMLGLLGVAGALAGGHVPGRYWGAAILVWGGALGMVLAGNLLTLFLAWVICDAGIVVASVQANDTLSRVLHRFVVNAVGGLALLGGAVVLKGQGPAGLVSEVATLPSRWLALFFLAGGIRTGLYPFHRSTYQPGDSPLPPLAVARMAVALSGVYLWLRGLPALQVRAEWWPFLVAAGGLIALASGVLAWGARDLRQVLSCLVGFELGVIVLNLGLNAHTTTLMAILELTNVVLAVAVLGITVGGLAAMGRVVRVWGQGLAFLALASSLGLPPTLGFVARWGLYRHAIESASLAPVLPVAVAGGLLVAPLLAFLRHGESPSPPGGAWPLVGSLLLGVPLVLASAQPLLLASLLAPLSAVSPYPVMAALIRTVDSGLGARIILLLLAPVLIGYSLDRVHASLRDSPAMDAFWRFLDLGWLYESLIGATIRAVIALGIILAFLQASSAVEWAILVALILLLLILRR